MNILEQARELGEEIKNTEEYATYINYKMQLENNPEIYKRVCEYRAKVFEFQILHSNGVYEAYENLINYRNSMDDLLDEPFVRPFLEAERSVTKIIRDVYETLSNEIDLDLGFLK